MTIPDLKITSNLTKQYEEILTSQCLDFLGKLHRQFEGERQKCLSRRIERQKDLDCGKRPDFLPETEELRKTHWKVATIPDELKDRRIEITGPVDRKMVINALNSGANVYMADFEDSHSPTWEGTMDGQINLRDAVRGMIAYTSPEGKFYKLHEKTATLFVRPRGWHLHEKHLLISGKPISGSIFDFGLFFFHNAKSLIQKSSAPYFYLPKIESHLEARLWNDIFLYAQKELDIPKGTIKATVLIETILAAFEMDEILYELRDHCAGLNCGRWDYIFNMIKRFHKHPEFILPDRAQVTMTTHCMRSYSQLAIQTCHRRGIHSMGGMAAQIPIKGDPKANEEALQKVRNDKQREVQDGHDGTWVAHPGLVALAKEEFDRGMPTPNQIDRLRMDLKINQNDLLSVPKGTITEEGLRTNIRIGIEYLESWFRGSGCVALYHLMEDAATAEISRTQIWQWIHHPKGTLNDGRKITLALFQQILEEKMTKIRKEIASSRYENGKHELSAKIFEEMISNEELEEFLTLRAYEYLP